jgi:hypothetical protein
MEATNATTQPTFTEEQKFTGPWYKSLRGIRGDTLFVLFGGLLMLCVISPDDWSSWACWGGIVFLAITYVIEAVRDVARYRTITLLTTVQPDGLRITSNEGNTDKNPTTSNDEALRTLMPIEWIQSCCVVKYAPWFCFSIWPPMSGFIKNNRVVKVNGPKRKWVLLASRHPDELCAAIKRQIIPTAKEFLSAGPHGKVSA